MNTLSTKRRSELRAEAHSLSPIVIIGDKGLTDEVVAEIDRSLRAHELIKVRAASGEREVRDVWMESICVRLLRIAGTEPQTRDAQQHRAVLVEHVQVRLDTVGVMICGVLVVFAMRPNKTFVVSQPSAWGHDMALAPSGSANTNVGQPE